MPQFDFFSFFVQIFWFSTFSCFFYLFYLKFFLSNSSKAIKIRQKLLPLVSTFSKESKDTFLYTNILNFCFYKKAKI